MSAVCNLPTFIYQKKTLFSLNLVLKSTLSLFIDCFILFRRHKEDKVALFKA